MRMPADGQRRPAPKREILKIYVPPGVPMQDIFLEAWPPEYGISRDDRDPDIMFLTAGWSRYHHCSMLRRALQARRRFGMRPLLCVNQMEAFPRPRLRGADLLFSFHPAQGKGGYCLRAPVTEWKNMERRRFEPQSAADRNRLAAPRTRFCNFIYSGRRYPSVQVRGYFCRLLSRYKRVDCPAASHNNAPRIQLAGGRGGFEEKLDFMASSKFTIAFENISTEYYLTEKIFHPLSVGSVPIYWGCRRVAEYINPECFINCHDCGSFAEVVEKVREIDQDPGLYARYRNAPPVLPDSRLHEALREMKLRMRRMAEEALERRKRKNEYPNLRQLAALALRNADSIADLLRLPLREDLAALANLAPLYREILRSRSWSV